MDQPEEWGLPNISHEAKCVLYTMGAVAELEKIGMIKGSYPVTVKGLGWFDQLDASGFRPSEEEIRKALAAYHGFENLNDVPDKLVLIISRWKEAVAFARQ